MRPPIQTLSPPDSPPLCAAASSSRRKTLAFAANTVNSAYTYDSTNRLLSLITKKGATPTLSSFLYTYDTRGNRATMTDAVGLHTYGYDTVSQLTSADEPAGGTPDLTLQYDPLGNRQQVVRGGVPEGYTPNTLNQYTDIENVPQGYDFDGNLTSDGTATYTYDAENRLTQVITGATTVQFTYDAFGRRASKTVNGVVTKFFYDGDDLLVETGNDPNALIARYLFGPGLDEPLERQGSTTHYYSQDGLGSTVHLTNTSGTIAESYIYDAFGQPTIRNGSGAVIPTTAVGNRFLFTGREWDSEIGLHYYRARYYSSKTGRFLSRDPIGPVDGPNLYTYVLNNPVNWIDPWGLQGKNNNSPGGDDPFRKGLPLIIPGGFPLPSPIGIPLGGGGMRPVIFPPGVTPASPTPDHGGQKGNGKSPKATRNQLDHFLKQLAEFGRKSLEKSQRSLEKLLQEHLEKLERYRQQPRGQTSSVEKEIKNFQQQLDAINQILGDP